MKADDQDFEFCEILQPRWQMRSGRKPACWPGLVGRGLFVAAIDNREALETER